MQMTMDVTLSRDEIEKAVREYVQKNLPEHTIGKLEWSVSAGHDDRFSYSPPSVNHVKLSVTPSKSPFVGR